MTPHSTMKSTVQQYIIRGSGGILVIRLRAIAGGPGSTPGSVLFCWLRHQMRTHPTVGARGATTSLHTLCTSPPSTVAVLRGKRFVASTALQRWYSDDFELRSFKHPSNTITMRLHLHLLPMPRSPLDTMHMHVREHAKQQQVHQRVGQ